ncbi:MAG: hypothetical protein SW833_13475 [Cyanobacteriota bacterium]|nr:hypothetical protein [Cyanobacteriota bacterium]
MGEVEIRPLFLWQIESGDRANCFRITAYQNREPNLQLFLSDEGVLLSVNENLTGSQPKLGYLLPQYNVKEHTVTSRPWGIAKLERFAKN